MATSAAYACLYTETALNLDQYHSQSIIEISLPNSLSFFSQELTSKRRLVSEVHPAEGDETFTRKHVASEASIFFRQASVYPRCLLWRLLDSRRVLELRFIDLMEPGSSTNPADFIYTIQLRFPSPVIPFGVAFASSKSKDVIHLFVITKSGDLYTFALPVSFFANKDASDVQLELWCHVFRPPSFTFKKPYRLGALSTVQLVVSINDGSLVLLTRPTSTNVDDRWTESFVSHSSWTFSLKSFLPWNPQETVKFDDLTLHSNCALGFRASPDRKYLFMVTLDHYLRSWNIKDKSQGVSVELATPARGQVPQSANFLLEPSQQDLLKVVDVPGPNGIQYYVVTYSPHYHQFKFWGVRDAGVQKGGITDVLSEFSFIPPVEELLNTTIWSLEEFVVDASMGWSAVSLWVRIQSGALSRVFTLQFNLLGDVRTLRRAWATNWVIVDPGNQTTDHLKSICPVDRSVDSVELHQRSSTEEWTEFLFYPSRFSVPSLESALTIYSGLDPSKPHPILSSSLPLKERMRRAIERNVTLTAERRKVVLDTDRLELEIALQWRLLFTLIKDLHHSRREPLSFAFDPVEKLPWMVRADVVSAIRQSSVLDTILLNYDAVSGRSRPSSPLLNDFFSDKVRVASHILYTAHHLRASLPSKFQGTLKRTVSVYVSQDPTELVSSRLVSFEQDCGLTESISDELADQVAESILEIGGYGGLKSQDLYDLLENIGQEIQGEEQMSNMAPFGAKVLAQGARETADLHMNVLLDLLVFVIFVGREIDPSDLSGQFDPSTLFAELMSQIKEQYVIDWLLRTVRERDEPDSPPTLPPTPVEENVDSNPASLKYVGSSVIETLFLGDWKDILTPSSLPMTDQITYWCRAWLFGLRLSQEFDSSTSNIGCFLLRSNEVDLVLEFLSFLPRTPWNLYLQSRALVKQGKFDLAAFKFKRAATSLSSTHFRIESLDWGLLATDDRLFFSSGICRFYTHVAAYFEAHKAYSHALDFLSLAIDTYIPDGPDPSFSMMSGPSGHSDILIESLRIRQFANAMELSDYQSAYEALTQMKSRTAQVQHLRTFVERLTGDDQVSLLLSLPFTFLQQDVDSILQFLCSSASPADVLNAYLSSSSSFSALPSSSSAKHPPSYHRILYAWRVSRNDFRAAAVIMYDLLQRLITARETCMMEDKANASRGKTAGGGGATRSGDLPTEYTIEAFEAQNKAIGDCYLMLINSLACCGEGQNWILTGKAPDFADLVITPEREEAVAAAASAEIVTLHRLDLSTERDREFLEHQLEARKRRILTLEDIRHDYQLELDHLSAIENGQFEFGMVSDVMMD